MYSNFRSRHRRVKYFAMGTTMASRCSSKIVASSFSTSILESSKKRFGCLERSSSIVFAGGRESYGSEDYRGRLVDESMSILRKKWRWLIGIMSLLLQTGRSNIMVGVMSLFVGLRQLQLMNTQGLLWLPPHRRQSWWCHVCWVNWSYTDIYTCMYLHIF